MPAPPSRLARAPTLLLLLTLTLLAAGVRHGCEQRLQQLCRGRDLHGAVMIM
jgi:hypothetical protein